MNRNAVTLPHLDISSENGKYHFIMAKIKKIFNGHYIQYYNRESEISLGRRAFHSLKILNGHRSFQKCCRGISTPLKCLSRHLFICMDVCLLLLVFSFCSVLSCFSCYDRVSLCSPAWS